MRRFGIIRWNNDMHELCVVIVLSGKRKSGKDYVAEKLQSLFGAEHCELIRLSAPLKFQFAQERGLDYEKLLASHGYKEQYRDAMIRWGEAKRDANPNFFCDLACAAGERKRVWIVTDARRPSDIAYFCRMQVCVVLVRIEADDDVRKRRGWRFTTGIDDCDSECALDNGIKWDYRILNNGEEYDEDMLTGLIDKCNSELLKSGCNEKSYRSKILSVNTSKPNDE